VIPSSFPIDCEADPRALLIGLGYSVCHDCPHHLDPQQAANLFPMLIGVGPATTPPRSRESSTPRNAGANATRILEFSSSRGDWPFIQDCAVAAFPDCRPNRKPENRWRYHALSKSQRHGVEAHGHESVSGGVFANGLGSALSGLLGGIGQNTASSSIGSFRWPPARRAVPLRCPWACWSPDLLLS